MAVSLKENGIVGIVLSSSIAGIDTHIKVREWLMQKMRIVALFDLPSNTFAETGVNVTILVAYKPKKEELIKLRQNNYQIFVIKYRKFRLQSSYKRQKQILSTHL